MKHPVIIAGAGIGGLCTAIALREQGIETRVLERAPKLEALGSGLSIFPNALEILDQLGVAAAVRAISMPVRTNLLMTPRGELIRSDARERTTVHRGELQRLLVERLEDGAVQVGSECVGFSQDEEGVTVRTASGGELRGSLLIGADGLRSRVRSQLWGEQPPRPANVLTWRGIASYSGLHESRQYLGRGARIGMAPVDGRRVYWYAAIRAAPGSVTDLSAGRAALRNVFADWDELINTLLGATDSKDFVAADLFDRPPVRRWGDRRVTLLGDAAHPMTPDLGMGAAQAMVDAVTIASCLRQEPSPVGALLAYENARVAYTGKLVRQARRLGNLLQIRNPIAAALRDAYLRWSA